MDLFNRQRHKFVDLDLDSVASLDSVNGNSSEEEPDYDFCTEAVESSNVYKQNNKNRLKRRGRGRGSTRKLFENPSRSPSPSFTDSDFELLDFQEDTDNWVNVEEDVYGNLHISTLDDYIPPLVFSEVDELGNGEHSYNEEKQSEPEEGWEVVQDDYSVIVKADKKLQRRLDRKSRAQTLAVGLSSVAASSAVFALFPSSYLLGNFLLINSADLIKLSVKGRSSKVTLDQRMLTLSDVLKEIAIKNGKLSAVTYSTAALSKFIFYSSTSMLPFQTLLLCEQIDLLSHLGIEVSPVELTEKAISGAAASISTQIFKSRPKQTTQRNQQFEKSGPNIASIDSVNNHSNEISKKKVRKKQMVKSAVWGGVTGVAGGVIGPVLSSSAAEKCVLEACTAGAKITEKVLVRN